MTSEFEARSTPIITQGWLWVPVSQLEIEDGWILMASWPLSLAEPSSVEPSGGLVSGNKGRER